MHQSVCARVAYTWSRALITTLLLLTCAATAASAQVLYGSIVGTVTDETGAVVPKAVVSVTNTSTGLARETTADDSGYYKFRSVPKSRPHSVGQRLLFRL